MKMIPKIIINTRGIIKPIRLIDNFFNKDILLDILLIFTVNPPKN